MSLQVGWGSLEDEFARGLAGRRQAAESEAGWQAACRLLRRGAGARAAGHCLPIMDSSYVDH